MRKSKDEADRAAFEALKGAGVGAVKVCLFVRPLGNP